MEQEEKSLLHLTVAGTKDAVMMVEAGAKEVPEEVILEAIMYGHSEIIKIVEFIEEFRQEALAQGLAVEKQEPILQEISQELEEDVRAFAQEKLLAAVQTKEKTRTGRKDPRGKRRNFTAFCGEISGRNQGY